MNIIEILYKLRKQRIFFILFNTILSSFIFYSIFIGLYLILPKIFLFIGLSRIEPIFIIFVVVFLFFLILNIYKTPFFGKNFLNNIINSPYSIYDIISSKNLTLKDEKLSDFSSYLKSNYISKINNNVSNKLNINRKIYLALIISLSMLSCIVIFKYTFLKDLKFAFTNNIHPRILISETEASFEFLELKIIHPAYIENTNENIINLLDQNIINLLSGSKLLVEGKVFLNDILEIKLLSSSNGNLNINSVSIEEGFFSSSFIVLDNSMFVLEFKVNDKEKIYKSKLFKVKIIDDNPPELIIISPDNEFKTSFGSEVPLVLNVTDDYGLYEINIFHKEAGKDLEYNKSLISRFRNKGVKEYKQTYYWNPVIRAGNKINELIYPLNVEKIEYYIEAKDANTFSNKGVTRSINRTIIFVDMFSELFSLEELIAKNLIEASNLKSKVDSNNFKQDDINNYKNFLNKQVDEFSDKLKNLFTDNSLIDNTKQLISSLGKDTDIIKKDLDNYINFLKNYLLLLNMLKNSEQANLVNNELKTIENMLDNGAYDTALDRIDNLFKYLNENHKDSLNKINDLIKAGNFAEAKKLMQDLISSIKNSSNENYKEAREELVKMTDMAIKLIEELMEKAKYLFEQQSTIKELLDYSDNIKSFSENQKILLKDYEFLYEKTKFLGLNYPMFNQTLLIYANKALEFASLTYDYLLALKKPEAKNAQELAITYLKEYLKAAQDQKQAYKNFQNSNFERFLSNNFKNSIVLIPKEAIYTIPIDYKKKVIDASKNRGSNIKVKDTYWKELLE